METMLRLIKRKEEFVPIEAIDTLPGKLRGIYVLYKCSRNKRFNVVYIGMSTDGMRGRLKSHRKSKTGMWTHCSLYEVWDNIRNGEILELEGVMRHIYRKDEKANLINRQLAYKPLQKLPKLLAKPGAKPS